jgi:hypothetical protein
MSNKKSYEGVRGPEGLLVYVVEGHESGSASVCKLSPRTDLVEHSPTGAFECGFKGAGPSQLSLAILADLLGDLREAIGLHMGFRDRVIVDLPRDRDWCLTESYIHAHLRALRASPTRKEASPTSRQ